MPFSSTRPLKRGETLTIRNLAFGRPSKPYLYTFAQVKVANDALADADLDGSESNTGRVILGLALAREQPNRSGCCTASI